MLLSTWTNVELERLLTSSRNGSVQRTFMLQVLKLVFNNIILLNHLPATMPLFATQSV